MFRGDDILKIEVTGVKGKTSSVFMLKEILIDENPLILSSLGALLYEDEKEFVLKRNSSITPANIKETVDLAYKIAKYFGMIIEEVFIFEEEAEETKVAIRNARRDGIDKLKKAIKDGLSEDVEKDAEADLQKIHDKMVKKVEELLAAKNKEIMTV